MKELKIETKSDDSRWAALDFNNKLIAEGKTPEEAIEKAEKITDKYALMFIPEKNITYIL